MNNSNQPTILVKKADGTSVRMTMEELRAYKKSVASPKPAVTSVVQPIQPIKKPESQKPTLAPVKQSPSPYNLVPKTYKRPAPPSEEKKFIENWEADDNKSLLDDSLEETKLPMVKSNNSNLPTTSAPVRDIFVDEAKYHEQQNKQSKSRGKLGIPTQASGPKSPAVTSNLPPVKFEKPKTEVKPVIPTTPQPQQQPKTYNLQPNTYTEAKPLIQDVMPPQTAKQSIGPIDELANFSLVDFRRLEINSKAAGLKLLEKFNNLKEDSYLLFIEAVKAWYNSPLYRQYQEVLCQSLAHGQSVNEIFLSGDIKKDLKSDEFKAILSVNEVIN